VLTQALLDDHKLRDHGRVVLLAQPTSGAVTG
jgi:hypothetical protein